MHAVSVNYTGRETHGVLAPITHRVQDHIESVVREVVKGDKGAHVCNLKIICFFQNKMHSIAQPCVHKGKAVAPANHCAVMFPLKKRSKWFLGFYFSLYNLLEYNQNVLAFEK